MAKLVKYMELFISLEGEGPQTGVPTVYLRTVGCTFTCRGFNNPNNVEITNEVLGFNPQECKTLEDIPGINIGCDTLYAFDKRFKHLWKSEPVDVVVKKLIDILPNNKWISDMDVPYMFSMTGGEPMLHQDMWIELLSHPDMQTLKSIIIESNLAVKMQPKFVDFLKNWLAESDSRKIWFSNSPKISNSGEPAHKAIVPENLIPQIELFERYPNQVVPYLKFVTDGSDNMISEITKAVDLYDAALPLSKFKFRPLVYLMPEACNQEQQDSVAKQVADICIQKGFIFSYRLQNALWGNEIGT